MKPNILMIILCLLSVFVSSCFERKTIRLELWDVSKQMIPYEIGKNYRFIDLFDQSFVMTVTEDTTYWEVMDEYSGGHFSWQQLRDVKLQSNSSNFDVGLQINSGGGIWVTIYSHATLHFSLNYDKKGNFYIADYYNYGDIYDSLDINGKTYYDVAESISTSIYVGVKRALLYNKTYGILQVSDEGETLFTINN